MPIARTVADGIRLADLPGVGASCEHDHEEMIAALMLIIRMPRPSANGAGPGLPSFHRMAREPSRRRHMPAALRDSRGGDEPKRVTSG